MSLVVKVSACVMLGFASGAASAATWTEIGDAGETVPTHQVPVGAGALTNIFGSLSGDADIYCIHIDGPFFSAIGSATFDSQLFLFDMSGVGIAANDDGGGFAGAGILPLGNALYSGLSGNYLIAISQYDYDPYDGAGALMFPTFPFPPVYGPFAGVGPLSSWGGGTGAGGTYDIMLTGASFCDFPVIPLPTPLGLSLAGLAGVAGIRRRR